MRSGLREISTTHGRKLRVTPVFDTYWRFAAERQRVFMRRVRGDAPPWTTDSIIAGHRFTNTYRASDRVSQYLIKNVIYDGSRDEEEVFFRILLFKIFNRIETWELLEGQFGSVKWKTFALEKYAAVMDRALANDQRLYSAAYIMPSPDFGNARKHRNHLALLDRMMRDGVPRRVCKAKSLREVFETLLAQPSLGGFLAFQFAIDLNYSEMINFSEMDFVVAGPGARDGISKCFADTGGLSDAEIIAHMASTADDEFARLGLTFEKLGEVRPLQLIDCQNIFCEVSKYARVAHPETVGASGRTRIKQKFVSNPEPLDQFYPSKWKLKLVGSSANTTAAGSTRPLELTSPASTPRRSQRKRVRSSTRAMGLRT
jgi:hypothetical protein